MNILTKGRNIYYTVSVICFISLFLLIVIGGTVRITGSGMGCPDWPKCFGRLIPPTIISDLPADYIKFYETRGYSKSDFPLMTWIEYLNRLWSVIIVGPLLLASTLLSLTWIKKDKSFLILQLLMLFLTGFTAWLGKIVVLYDLDSLRVTIHLIPALIIVSISVIICTRLNGYRVLDVMNNNGIDGLPNKIVSKNYQLYLISGFIIISMQILLGTQVRTEIDKYITQANILDRADWIIKAYKWLPIHKLFSTVVTIIVALIYIASRKTVNLSRPTFWGAILMIGSVSAQIITGTLLTEFSFPAASQLLHLTFSTSLLCGIILCISDKYFNPANVKYIPISE
ncbi:MAG: COX15/CtaA family protein [Bacteroidota bacterium]|nr:COX15/CtaA family protein [Bacteroidota bacterium]